MYIYCQRNLFFKRRIEDYLTKMCLQAILLDIRTSLKIRVLTKSEIYVGDLNKVIFRYDVFVKYTRDAGCRSSRIECVNAISQEGTLLPVIRQAQQ